MVSSHPDKTYFNESVKGKESLLQHVTFPQPSSHKANFNLLHRTKQGGVNVLFSHRPFATSLALRFIHMDSDGWAAGAGGPTMRD